MILNMYEYGQIWDCWSGLLVGLEFGLYQTRWVKAQLNVFQGEIKEIPEFHNDGEIFAHLGTSAHLYMKFRNINS